MTLKTLPFTHPLHLVMGFIIWAFWLTLVYARLTLGCTAASAPAMLGAQSWLNLALLGFTMIVTTMLLMLGFLCWRSEPINKDERQAHFILRVSAALYLCAAIATLAGGIPTLMLPPCL